MNSSSPKISIIVPNYNYAHFLDKRIESILKQTYTDYEIILLDDASTDDSVKVLEKYNETRPIMDGFRKNNVNYWVFSKIRSIIRYSLICALKPFFE